MMGTESRAGRVNAAFSCPASFLQSGGASGLLLCCLSTPQAAAHPLQLGASPSLTSSFCGAHVSSIRAVKEWKDSSSRF